MRAPSYLMRPCSLDAVRALCEAHHGYGSAGGTAVYAFGVYEQGRMVAGYSWQPPPYGAARSVCEEASHGVLSLSRMVAVPRGERQLNHVSKPLRRQMRVSIDRGRWPVLVTYSDEGQGHSGHVYRCSGWRPTLRVRRAFAEEGGARVSLLSNGRRSGAKVTGHTWLQRWEHWVCPRGKAAEWMERHGWEREPIPGKVWASGNQAHRIAKPHPVLPWGK